MMQYDTYQGGLNPLSRNHYTYAHNNPVNLEDPSGNSVAAISFLIVRVTKFIADKGTDFAYAAIKEFNKYTFIESVKITLVYSYHFGLPMLFWEQYYMLEGIKISLKKLIIVPDRFAQGAGKNTGFLIFQTYMAWINNLFKKVPKDYKVPNICYHCSGFDNRNTKGPSVKVEEYWVPIYISHGENKTIYR